MSFAIVALLVAQLDGGAASHPLEGEWQLDLALSTDTTAILEQRGVSWFVRQAAKSTRPIHRVRVNRNTLFLEVDTPVKKKRFQLVLDGTTPADDDFFGEPIHFTTVLAGGVFRSTGTLGEKSGLTLERSLRDDGLMLYRITITPKDGGAPTVIDRVFRRTK